ncbi:MAG: aminodeoxychorismate/anthranilate synthase component II [Phycisphaerales bacterium]|nr:aminodeoxychorismate/anthranilate synthase component II [Phycisphaerales bacterium]
MDQLPPQNAAAPPSQTEPPAPTTHPAAHPRVLMIDNYDSFTYNLVQLLMSLGANVRTFRNDAISVTQAEKLNPTHLVISPGPGGPREAGVSMKMIEHFAGKTPVLGVCLGHQAMAEVFGGTVGRAPRLMHGKASLITHDGKGVYTGLPSPVEVGRYHSLAILTDKMPANFTISAQTDQREIMGIRHTSWPVEGVQFHPESVLTPSGSAMIRNFLTPAPAPILTAAPFPPIPSEPTVTTH